MDSPACLLMLVDSLCQRDPALRRPACPPAETGLMRRPACPAVTASRQGLLRAPVYLQSCSAGQHM